VAGCTTYLQEAFRECGPAGWTVHRELTALPRELARFPGYNARADVVLQRADGSRRLWIEFEVSRADPVANHAKFATAHLFRPQPQEDVFVGMVSSHVTRGRRNLGAGAVWLMRSIGMQAFQTVLLPQHEPAEVKRLNHLPIEALRELRIPATPEIERVMAVVAPQTTVDQRRIHFASDFPEVMANIRRWNLEVATPEGGQAWGRRKIRYLVIDPSSGLFAPAKFCAYVALARPERGEGGVRCSLERGEMTVGLYARVGEDEPKFDGTVARRYLTEKLGMVECSPDELRERRPAFERWVAGHADGILLDARGPVIMRPPAWFR
jgi:hypothetical protein